MLNLRMQLPQPKQKHSFLLWKNPNRVNDPGGIIPLANYGVGGVFIISPLNTYSQFLNYLFITIGKYFTLSNIPSVINLDNGEIIPSGIYTYIDSFYNGIARVKIGSNSNCICDGGIWGVITEDNEIIVTIEYHYIQPLENNRDDRIYLVHNDGHKEYISLDALK